MPSQPRKKRSPIPVKVLVAGAVSLAGRELASMVRTITEAGGEITQFEFDKAFAHMRVTLDALEAQARKERMFVAAGSFSFDNAMPTVALAPVYTPRPAPAYARAVDVPISIAGVAPLRSTSEPDAEPAPSPAQAKRFHTGRIARSSPDPEAGQPTFVEVKTVPIRGSVGDKIAGIMMLGESEAESK